MADGFVFTTNLSDVDVKSAEGVAKFTAEQFAVMSAGMHEVLDVAQQIVHVRTGRLKNSGRVEEDLAKLSVSVAFGGDEYDVDYAGWDELEYPYLEPAVQQVLGTGFGGAL